jgi:hypothetical protein
MGAKIYQFHGKDCSGFERAKAGSVVRAIDDQRGSNLEIVVFNEDDSTFPEDWEKLLGHGPYQNAVVGGIDKKAASRKELYQVTDESGKIEFRKLGEGKAINRSMVGSDDCYILYARGELFTYLGAKASTQERASVFGIAVKFMKETNIPASTTIHRMLEGGENEIFEEAFV